MTIHRDELKLIFPTYQKIADAMGVSKQLIAQRLHKTPEALINPKYIHSARLAADIKVKAINDAYQKLVDFDNELNKQE